MSWVKLSAPDKIGAKPQVMAGIQAGGGGSKLRLVIGILPETAGRVGLERGTRVQVDVGQGRESGLIRITANLEGVYWAQIQSPRTSRRLLVRVPCYRISPAVTRRVRSGPAVHGIDGASLIVTIPADVLAALDLELGDRPAGDALAGNFEDDLRLGDDGCLLQTREGAGE